MAGRHHYFKRFDKFAETFPKVKLLRGVRFVENEKVSAKRVYRRGSI